MKNGFTIHISQIPIQLELDNMMCTAHGERIPYHSN
jgi:hypothetical protein